MELRLRERPREPEGEAATNGAKRLCCQRGFDGGVTTHERGEAGLAAERVSRAWPIAAAAAVSRRGSLRERTVWGFAAGLARARTRGLAGSPGAARAGAQEAAAGEGQQSSGQAAALWRIRASAPARSASSRTDSAATTCPERVGGSSGRSGHRGKTHRQHRQRATTGTTERATATTWLAQE
jgi:hypothetical protein